MTNPLNNIMLGGKQVQLYFGYPCFNEYTMARLENPSALSLQEGDGLAKLLQCAYNNHCLIKEVKPELTYEDFYMWVEERLNEDNKAELEELLNIFAQCTTTKNSLKKVEELNKSIDEKKSLIAV